MKTNRESQVVTGRIQERSRKDKVSSGIGYKERFGMETTERFVEDTRKPVGDTGRLRIDRDDTEWEMQENHR
jgi:hypothetical protein